MMWEAELWSETEYAIHTGSVGPLILRFDDYEFDEASDIAILAAAAPALLRASRLAAEWLPMLREFMEDADLAADHRTIIEAIEQATSPAGWRTKRPRGRRR